MFEKEQGLFREHVRRVTVQYQELRNLKENLPANEVIVQMDFAENYSCTVSDNVQSSYWNQTGVTLHPCVIYYCNDGNISHKSTVYVSDAFLTIHQWCMP